MNSNDQKRFKELVTSISDTYGKEFTPSELKMWWNIFKPYSINDFEKAVYLHLSDPDSGMYSPKPANIIKFITGTNLQNEKNLECAAELAWQSVEGEIRAVGSYGSPRIEDGLALAAIKSLGGWTYLCGSTTDQLTWLRKEFISSYQNYATTPVELLPKSLPGRIEIENAKRDGNGEGMKSIGNILNKLKLENKND